MPLDYSRQYQPDSAGTRGHRRNRRAVTAGTVRTFDRTREQRETERGKPNGREPAYDLSGMLSKNGYGPV